MAQLKRRAHSCGMPVPMLPDAVRQLQSLFGAVRRAYAALLMLHPSIPFELHSLLSLLPDPQQAALAAPRQLEMVFSRCMESVRPALRILPAALLPASRVRTRAVVYERCTPGAHMASLPTFDVRDQLTPLTRRVLHTNRSRDARDDPEPLNAAAATTESELTPPYSLQRQSATTPATIAAIGKPRPANGSLKKNIEANEASKTPPPLFIAVT